MNSRPRYRTNSENTVGILRKILFALTCLAALACIVTLFTINRRNSTALSGQLLDNGGAMSAVSEHSGFLGVVFDYFGNVTYLFPLILVYFGYKLFLKHFSLKNIDFFVIGMLILGFNVLIIGCCALFSTLSSGALVGAGGILGDFFTIFLKRMFPSAVANLLPLLVTLVGIMLFTAKSPLWFCDRLGALLFFLYAKITGKDLDEDENVEDEKDYTEKSAFEEHEAKKAARDRDVTSEQAPADIKGPTGPIFKENLPESDNGETGFFDPDDTPKFGEGLNNTLRPSTKIGFGDGGFGEGGTYNHERERNLRTKSLQGLFTSGKNEGYHERIEPGFGSLDKSVDAYSKGSGYTSSMRDNSNFDKDASSTDSSEPSTYITGNVSFSSNEATAKDYDTYDNYAKGEDARTGSRNDTEKTGTSTIISGLNAARNSDPQEPEVQKPETLVHKTIISRFDPKKEQSDKSAYAKPLSYDDDKTTTVTVSDKKEEKSSTIIYKAPYDRGQNRNLDNINNEVSTVITRTTVYPKTTDSAQGKAFRPQDPYAKERATTQALKAKTSYQEENVINFSDLAKEQMGNSGNGISVSALGQSFIQSSKGTVNPSPEKNNEAEERQENTTERDSSALSTSLAAPIKESDLTFEQYARGTRGVTQKAKDSVQGVQSTGDNSQSKDIAVSAPAASYAATATQETQTTLTETDVFNVQNTQRVEEHKEENSVITPVMTSDSTNTDASSAALINTESESDSESKNITLGAAVAVREGEIRENTEAKPLIANTSENGIDLDNAPDITTFAGVVNKNSVNTDYSYERPQETVTDTPLTNNDMQNAFMTADTAPSSADTRDNVESYPKEHNEINHFGDVGEVRTKDPLSAAEGTDIAELNDESSLSNADGTMSKIEDDSFTREKIPFEDMNSLNGTVPYGSSYESSSRFSSVPTVTYAVATETSPKFEYGDFRPDIKILAVSNAESVNNEEEIQNKCNVINKFMEDFGAKARVVSYVTGPVITRFDLSLEPGVKSSSIINLSIDLQRFLMTNKINMIACVPGTPYMGIEVPNDKGQVIRLGDVVSSEEFLGSNAILPMCVGVDTVGRPVIADLTQAPHLLIAGTTGSGKSSGLNSMLVSLLLAKSPAELRLIMVDPKTVEFSQYQGLPHLLTPIVTDPEATAACLGWLIKEMERRYKLLATMGCSNIQQVNSIIKNQHAKGEVVYDPIWTADMGGTPPVLKNVPYILLVIDEFADLMAMASSNKKGTNPEQMIGRLAAKARAAGIHLILATQTPRADIVTGSIRANMPSRIAYTVQNGQESRIVLDETGAENLLGNGDMMIKYQKLNRSQLFRAHGPFTSNEDVAGVVEAWKQYAGDPEYIEGVTDYVDEEAAEEAAGQDMQDSNIDAKFDSIVDWIRTQVIPSGMKKLSISEIQTTHAVGYNRAKRIHRALIQQNIIDSKGNIIV